MSQSLLAEDTEPPAKAWQPSDEPGSAHSGRIPASPNPLIGREDELATVRGLLECDDVRLITLTGPGGVGKTRLALALATDIAAQELWPHVVFVPLAPVLDSGLAPAAIATRLAVHESGSQSLTADIIAALQDERVLLVLDNVEHLRGVAPLVSDLLIACPELTVLATSRRRLGIAGEHEFPVPPLAVASVDGSATVEQVTASPAIQLFVARAQAAASGFVLTAANASPIAEICQRLDGLPLAIELAAPRTRMLSPAALLSRLTNRLQVLTGGPGDAPERQQTMRQAIGWSYDLLDPAARMLLRSLAVFVGGFTLEAVETVNSRGVEESSRRDGGVSSTPRLLDSSTSLDVVSSLVDESLVQITTPAVGARRFTMLETVREYALERLAEAGEGEHARDRHAGYCLTLAEQADPWQGVTQPWLDRMQADHDNLRAALVWSIAHNPETALRLTSALWRFWSERGYWSEGRDWLEKALTAGPDVAPAVRAAALGGAGTLAVDQGDYGHARLCHEQSLALARQSGDERRAARALRALGIVASSQNDLDGAVALFEEALLQLRTQRDQAAVGRCLCDLGLVATRRGDHQSAIAFYDEALPLARATGDQAFTAILLSNLAGAYMDAGDLARAEALFEEALHQSRILADRFGMAINLHNLADCVHRRGDIDGAWERYRESLTITHELGQFPLVSRTLDRVADLLANAALPRPAAHLLGAAAALRRVIGDELFPIEEEHVAASIAATRAALSAEAFQAAWEAGESLSPEQAVAEALAMTLPPALAEQKGPRQRALELGLTPRELEVLMLVCAGQADKEIAAALAISRHTASKHVAAARAKLHASSRSAAVTAAHEAGLL